MVSQWELTLYHFAIKNISLISSDKIKTRPFHSTKRFIDGLWDINGGGEFGKFVCNIYLKELELKVEHLEDYATFLNLDTTIREVILIYKLFDKRDFFLFSIVRMPQIESNIPRNFFVRNQKWVFKNCLFNSIRIVSFVVRLTDERRLALLPAGTIVSDTHHRKSLTQPKQDLSLHRTRVQVLLNEVV